MYVTRELYTSPERLDALRGVPIDDRYYLWPDKKVGQQEKRPAPRLRRIHLYAFSMTRKLLCCLLLEEAILVKARWVPRVGKSARACMLERTLCVDCVQICAHDRSNCSVQLRHSSTQSANLWPPRWRLRASLLNLYACIHRWVWALLRQYVSLQIPPLTEERDAKKAQTWV